MECIWELECDCEALMAICLPDALEVEGVGVGVVTGVAVEVDGAAS